jgi:hypothetical protein
MPQSPKDPSKIAGGRGRPFAKGNPGRKRGSRNRTSQIATALLEGEETELFQKALQIGRGGNVPMLIFLLGRLLPKDRRIKFDLPQMQFADDAIAALDSIMRAVSEGVLSPSEGAAFTAMVDVYVRAIETADLVKRIDILESDSKRAV